MLARFGGLSQSAEIQCYDKYFISLYFIVFIGCVPFARTLSPL